MNKPGFVTIQNNIVLKHIAFMIFSSFCFVTIQNNIVLKLGFAIIPLILCFVTIQNNIVLKLHPPTVEQECWFCYHSK